MRVFPVLQEVSLQFGHRELFLWQALGEVVGELLLLREELEEQALDHGEGGVAQLDVHVAATRSEQCWIELLFVVGSHEEDAALLGPDTVQGVEEAGEGYSTFLALLHRFSLNEYCVDIFQKNDGVCGSARQQTIKLVVVEAATRQVDIANVEFKCASNSLGEGGLAGARRTIQEVATSVGDASIPVPLLRGLEVEDVLAKHLRVVLVEDHRFK